MKIYTVISYSYDYYEFENWIMTTAKLDKVNDYLAQIVYRDEQVKNWCPKTEVFFINIDSDFVPDTKEERHIRVYVTEE